MARALLIWLPMSTAIAPPPAAGARPVRRIAALCAQGRELAAAYVNEPGEPETARRVRGFRRAAATVVAGLPAAARGGPEFEALAGLRRVLAETGIDDRPVDPADLALVRELGLRGWSGLLAAMLLVPAFQWPEAPRLDEVPPWLWAEYTDYLFYTPQGFCAPGQADAYAAHYRRRLADLARIAARNRGSAAVRSALAAYVRCANAIPLYFASGPLREQAELRGRILTLAAGGAWADCPPPLPRAGRRLRVGFINRHFGPQTETYTTLPTFELLDPARFEVILFAHRQTGLPLEDHARRHAAAFDILPADPGEQLRRLRAAGLDVAVFGTNVTAVVNEVTQLALHRVAPLQVVNNSSCITTGLPEIDLYVSGDLTEAPDAPAHFSERLGLLPGPAHAFDYEADRQEPSGIWTRAALGLPESAVVFVSAANYFKIIPEMQRVWARLLAAVPGSRLLVHPFNPNWSSSYPVKRFCAEFDRVLAEAGVDPDRLVVSANRFPSRADVKELLRVGDVYLDTFPFGGVNSLVDPLECGLPVVAWEGATFRSRMGAALLRALGLDDLVATDETGYIALAAGIAGDPARRAALQARIGDAMSRAPVFLDPLAASDAFGALLETAYDELVAVGHAEFRARSVPVVAAPVADPERTLAEAAALLGEGRAAEASAQARRVLGNRPASVAARRVLGRCLLAQGQAEQAAAYFLAAIPHAPADANLWLELAGAFFRGGRPKDATQAVEASLRIDPNAVEAWLLVAELAAQAGSREMVGKALVVARSLAPNDARVRELCRREDAGAAAGPGAAPC